MKRIQHDRIPMTEIDYIKGRKRQDVYGISKYNNEIYRRQQQFQFNIIEYSLRTSNPNVDGLMKRTLYPLMIHHSSKKENIKHITSQDLAFILNILSLYPSVITCFDIIPWTFYKNRSLYWRFNMKGLKKAEKIVAISHYTKNELISNLKIPSENIEVVHCGVDHQIFRKLPKEDLHRQIFGLSQSSKIVLYVGSEEPRKNFSTLLKAMHAMKKDIPTLHLLKVGKAFPGSRKETLELVNELGLRDSVTFLDTINEESLPSIYNIADVFVFPSFAEGFGLPPLEAMACGTPVVSSSATSLPEVTADAALLIDPFNTKQLKETLSQVITSEELQAQLSQKGQERAKSFSWEAAAEKMSEIYNEMSDRIK